MTLIARVHLTRTKKHSNSAQTTCTCLQWCFWICLQRGYSSVVEHSAGVREVLGPNPGVPLYSFWKTREKLQRSREYTWLGPKKHCNSAQTTCTCLQWYYWICMQRGYSSVVEQSAAVQEVPGPNPGVPSYNFWKTREKWHRSRE